MTRSNTGILGMDSKVFDTLLEPVFVIDIEKRITYCNEVAAQICDLSVRKLCKGIPIDQAILFLESPHFLPQLAQIAEATPYQELSFQSTSGKNGKAQITCQPLGPVNWLIFFRDVTLEETLQKKYRAELEQVQHYSKNLEKMVDERTAEIRKLNSTMSALLDSLHQGFFIFDRGGICLDVASKACETTIECQPAGKKIWDVLKLEEREHVGFQRWMTTLFAEMLPFEDLSVLGPQSFPHSEMKHIKLEYYPIKNNDNSLEAIVVVATDITNLVAAQQEAESERAKAKMILSLVKNHRQVAGYMRECRDLLSGLEAEIKAGENLNQENAFRILHTLKGGASLFSIKPLADCCHQAENTLTSLKWNGIQNESIEKFKNQCFEVEKEFLAFQIENLDIIGDESKLKERWIEAPVSKLFAFRENHLKNLQTPMLSDIFTELFVMEPVHTSFVHFDEVIKNVADRDGKIVLPLKIVGGDLRVLPEAYESLFQAMVHAFRNSVDHGIETPEERAQQGKPEAGQIEVYFDRQQRDNIEFLFIKVIDDGKGISPDIIRKKLLEKGLASAQAESDSEVIQHIFDAQFSTAEQVTDTSGRGVGMDAIAYAAQALKGKAWVESKPHVGTQLCVLVPFIRERSLISKQNKTAA